MGGREQGCPAPALLLRCYEAIRSRPTVHKGTSLHTVERVQTATLLLVGGTGSWGPGQSEAARSPSPAPLYSCTVLWLLSGAASTGDEPIFLYSVLFTET